MTLCDRFVFLYQDYCAQSNDDAFNVHASNILEAVMYALDLTGREGFTQMRAALNIFEYDLDPADPAFCHSVNLILNTLEMSVFNDGPLILDDDEE